MADVKIDVGGKQYGLMYTIGAKCDYEDWIVAHKDVSASRGNVHLAYHMAKAWAEINGVEPPKLADFMALPAHAYRAIEDASKYCLKVDTTQTVETESSDADKGKKKEAGK